VGGYRWGTISLLHEDAKRPNRERDCLVGERTRIVNRIKSTLVRLGIRTFKPTGTVHRVKREMGVAGT
jgi:transposase